MKSFKTPKMINSLLHNKFVLYATVIFTMMNVLGYMMNNCNYTVAFFALTAFVTSMFTKNMILILGGSICLTNTFMVCKVAKESFLGGSEVEGMENKDKNDGAAAPKKDKKDDKEKKEEDTPCPEGQDRNDDGKCVSSMTTYYRKDNNVDYAATVEDAYGELDKILGSDGIKNLSDDTNKLVKQQQQLAGLMKNMTPMVGQVKEMMASMGGADGMKDMMTNLSNQMGGANK